EPLWRLHLEHVAHPSRDVVEPPDPERQAHPPLRAELVDQERMRGALRPLEQQSGPAGLDGAVDDLGELEVWVDLGGAAYAPPLALEQGDPVAEVGERHRSSLRPLRGVRLPGRGRTDATTRAGGARRGTATPLRRRPRTGGGRAGERPARLSRRARPR